MENDNTRVYHPKFWDIKKNRIKPNCPNKEIIQKIINDKLTELQNRVLELNAYNDDYSDSYGNYDLWTWERYSK